MKAPEPSGEEVPPPRPWGRPPESGSSFALSFLFLPKEKKEALRAVYAFARRLDDIVDEPRPGSDPAAELDFWRSEVDRLYEENPTHPISKALLPFVRGFRLPREGFRALIDGVSMDLAVKRYETFADLEKYLFGVAGSVGLLCVEIFGYRHTSAGDIRAFAVAMGNAFQLTNILRDVGTDLERGRIYLPLEDIKEAGYSPEAFVRREHSGPFLALMNREHRRASEYYRRARSLLDPRDRAAMAPAEVMAQVYEALLDELKASQFHVFFHRASLPAWTKLRLAARGWLYSHGLY